MEDHALRFGVLDICLFWQHLGPNVVHAAAGELYQAFIFGIAIFCSFAFWAIALRGAIGLRLFVA